MIYLSKPEVMTLVLFIRTLPLKVELVVTYFLKNMLKQAFIAIFSSVQFSLRPKNEWVALVAFKLSVC